MVDKAKPEFRRSIKTEFQQNEGDKAKDLGLGDVAENEQKRLRLHDAIFNLQDDPRLASLQCHI